MAGSGNDTPNGDNDSVNEGVSQKKKFLNGWTSELEDLMADWADKAACYRWMHEHTSRIYGGRDRMITIPVIILSTLTGSASLSLDSFFPPGSDVDLKKYVQSTIGGVSILAGIITTVGNFLRYAQGCEAHHLAAVSWGKFNRLICIEMSLHPNERMDNYNFLKMFRVELDRLIEQSPPIPDLIIEEFKKVFKDSGNVKKPEIVGILEHTKVYKDSGARLKRIAAEAAITLHHKKNVLKNIIIEDLDRKFRSAAIEEARKVAHDIIKDQMQKDRKSAKADVSSTKDLVSRQKKERAEEIQQFSNTGLVSELKNRFRKVESDHKIYPDKPGNMNPTVRFEENPTEKIIVHPEEIHVKEKWLSDYTTTDNTVTTYASSEFPSYTVSPHVETEDEYTVTAVSGSATDNEEENGKK